MSRIKRRVPQRGKDGSKDRRSHEQKEPQGIMAAAFEKAMVMGGEKKPHESLKHSPEKKQPSQAVPSKPAQKAPVKTNTPPKPQTALSRDRQSGIPAGEAIQPRQQTARPGRAQPETRSARRVCRWKAVPGKNPFSINPSRACSSKTLSMEEGTDLSAPLEDQCLMTQCIPKGESSQELELVVGFDFGTSCSKVVIQDVSRRKAYAVPFEGLSCAQNKYLIPARIGIRENGSLSLCGGVSIFDNLKVSLIANRDSVLFREAETGMEVRPRHLISGYMALVLREVRKWFWATHGDVYKGTHLIWQVNVGMPSRSYDDSSMLNAFRTAALAGWNLSVQKCDVTLLSVFEAVSAAERELKGQQAQEPSCAVNGFLHPDMVQSVPEVVAEVVSYARSPMRRNGMYLMIDVGASTLDVSTFILHEDGGEDIFPILAADVQQLGSIKLHFERIKHVAKAVETHLGDVMKSADPDKPLPEMSDYAPKVPNATAVDERFQRECSKVIARLLPTQNSDGTPMPPSGKQVSLSFSAAGALLMTSIKRRPGMPGNDLRQSRLRG